MDKNSIALGMRALCAADTDIERAFPSLGDPPPRQRPAGFETLVATIVSQQIATQAARAILQRVHDLLPQLTPSALLALDDQALRSAGLSLRKIEYAKGLAAAIVEGRFAMERLEQLDDLAAIEQITALRGFGRWSAEIYLMFSLGRRDIFPADDLALRVALGRLKGLTDKPTPAEARALTAHWAPWRSVGALFLWHYYHGAPA